MTLKKLLKICCITTLSIAVPFSALWYYLTHHNVTLDLNKPYVNKIISAQFDQTRISIAKTTYHFDKNHNLVFNLSNVTIDHNRYNLIIPKLRLTYKFVHFLRFKFIPKIMFIQSPLIKINDTKALSPSFDINVIKKLSYLNSFKSIQLQQGLISYQNYQATVNLTLSKIDHQRYINIILKDQKQNTLALQGALSPNRFHFVGLGNLNNISFNNFNLKCQQPIYLKSIINFNDVPASTLILTASDAVSYYNDLNLFEQPVSITFQNLIINYAARQGKLIYNGYLNDDFLNHSQPIIRGVSTFKIAPYQNHVAAHHHARLSQFNVAKLSHYWPLHLAKPARTWITHNFKAGTITYGDIQCDTQFDKYKPIKVQNVHGRIIVDDMTLSYVDTMPVITNLMGQATYNQHGFDISIHSAQHNGMIFKQGRVVIGDFLEPNITLAITAPVTGSLRNLISVINSPPLHFARQISYLKNYQGQLSGLFTLQFPLTSPFNPHDMVYRFDGYLSQFTLTSVFDFPIAISQGRLKTQVNNHSFYLKGPALINGAISTVEYRKTLSPSPEHHLTVNSQIKAQHLLPYDVDLSNYWQGHGNAVITLDQIAGKPAVLKLTIDCQHCIFNSPLLNKSAGDSCVLSCAIKFKNNKVSNVQDLVFIGPHFKTLGSMNFKDQPYGLASLNLNYFYKDKADINLKYSSLADIIDIQGSLLNLSGFDLSKLISGEPQSTHLKNNHITVQLGTLIINPDHPFKNVTLELLSCHNTIYSMALTAQGFDKLQIVNLVDAHITTHNNQTSLDVQSLDTGILLNSLGLSNHIKHGNLKITAEKSKNHAIPRWQGDLELEKFSIRNVHGFARLVAAVFPTGLMDLKSKDGLGFNFLKTHFYYTPSKLMVTSGHAYGHSLGLTFKGDIILTQPLLFNITGSIIPAYFLNSLLSKIPLVGDLLLGGKHEGLFAAAFNYKGPLDQARIKINPLSTLTPGFLRQLFMSTTDSDDATDHK